MTSLQKKVRANCLRLADSGRTFEDIYRIVFSEPDAVMTEDGSLVGPSRYRTYGQIRDEAEAIARGIYALTGETGRYVGLYGENKPQWFSLFWGILQSGNYPYLINLRQPAEFTEDALKTLNALAVICLQTPPVDFHGVPSYPCAQVLEKAGDFTEDLSSLPFGNRFALSTSGTTLSRKICIYTGQNVSAQILNVLDLMKHAPGLVATYKSKLKHLVFLPLYHIFGLEAMFLWYAFWHSTFVFPPDLSPDHLLRTVRNHDVTHIFAVPLLWSAVANSVQKEAAKDPKTLKKLEKGLSLSITLQRICPPLGKAVAARLFEDVRRRLFGDSLQFCISGGSHVKPEALRLINGMGYHLCNGYGMSEVGISSLDLSRNVKKRIEATLGTPFPSVEYSLDSAGHLLVRGASVCSEMIVDGVLRETKDWFDTGDLMTRDGENRYSILGRASDIVFGEDGENRNPDLAEQAFTLTEAKNFCVLGDEKNENLILVIQLPTEFSEEQRERLKEEILRGNQTLPASYRIKKIRYTNDPIMGPKEIKVSRARLRRWINEGTVRLSEDLPKPQEFQGEESPLKGDLRRLFAEILDTDPRQISDDGHFMNDLGGSSLDYFTLIGTIDERYGVTLEFETEQFHYSLNDFERIIGERIQK